jgi:hypothetical protein
MRKIIKYTKDGAESEDVLYRILIASNVSFTDACSCKKLFIMFLENSENLLLARLLGESIHKGRNGSALAVETFKSIW